MKRPSFQFYPGDWAANPNLKRCTFAEKGVWLEVMCLMHDQPEYGVLRWPMREISEAVKCKPAELQALIRKGVLKGDDKQLGMPFVYVPRTGRKDGDPIILVPIQAGPVWYSSRMVKDEHVRIKRGENDGNGATPKTPPNSAPKPTIGDGFGPHASSSSSPPSGKETSDLAVAPARPPADQPQLSLVDKQAEKQYLPPDCPHLQVLSTWAEILPAMPQHDPQRWRGAKADHLRVRWKETAVLKRWPSAAEGLAYFRKLFDYIGQSAFLTGRAKPIGDKRPFVIELEWLVSLSNWDKVHEGKYHQEAA